MSGCCSTKEDIVELEERIAKEVSAYGRRRYAEALRKICDKMPHTGSDGVMLLVSAQNGVVLSVMTRFTV